MNFFIFFVLIILPLTQLPVIVSGSYYSAKSVAAKNRRRLETRAEELYEKLGISYPNRPHLIVVGRQNAGKTSLINRLLNLRMTVGNDVHTIAATEYVHERISSQQDPIFDVEIIIKRWNDAKGESASGYVTQSGMLYKNLSTDELPSAVAQAEFKVLRLLKMEHIKNLASLDVGNIIRIHIRQSEARPLLITDLPGILSDGGIPNTLSEHYLSDRKSIPISMFTCESPLEEQHTHEMVRDKVAMENHISVLSKPDLCPGIDNPTNEMVQRMWQLICRNEDPVLKSANGWFVIYNPELQPGEPDPAVTFFQNYPFWQRVLDYDNQHGDQSCSERFMFSAFLDRVEEISHRLTDYSEVQAYLLTKEEEAKRAVIQQREDLAGHWSSRYKLIDSILQKVQPHLNMISPDDPITDLQIELASQFGKMKDHLQSLNPYSGMTSRKDWEQATKYFESAFRKASSRTGHRLARQLLPSVVENALNDLHTNHVKKFGTRILKLRDGVHEWLDKLVADAYSEERIKNEALYNFTNNVKDLAVNTLTFNATLDASIRESKYTEDIPSSLLPYQHLKITIYNQLVDNFVDQHYHGYMMKALRELADMGFYESCWGQKIRSSSFSQLSASTSLGIRESRGSQYLSFVKANMGCESANVLERNEFRSRLDHYSNNPSQKLCQFEWFAPMFKRINKEKFNQYIYNAFARECAQSDQFREQINEPPNPLLPYITLAIADTAAVIELKMHDLTERIWSAIVTKFLSKVRDAISSISQTEPNMMFIEQGFHSKVHQYLAREKMLTSFEELFQIVEKLQSKTASADWDQ